MPPEQDDMGMEQMYGGGDTKPEAESEAPENDTEDNANEVVVPLKVLMGPDGKEPEEGDEIVVKVGKKYGDEAAISYSNTDPASIGKNESYKSSSDSEIEALDQG